MKAIIAIILGMSLCRPAAPTTEGGLSDLLKRASATYDVPSKLLAAVLIVESRLNPTALNPNDGGSQSIGVGQLKLSTAQFLGFTGTVKELMDVETNIRYTAMYLAYQLRRYHENWRRASEAYNQGWSGDIVYSLYTRKVEQKMKEVEI